MNNHQDHLNTNDRHAKGTKGTRTPGPDTPHRQENRDNSMSTRAGSTITGPNGYLLRNRAGWDVPVGREAASLLSEGVGPREAAILEACEQLGVLTVEQAARAFFNNPRSAYTQLRFLESRRFLARIQVDRATIRLATATAYEPGLPVANGRHRRNPVYILDWNGYYFLAERNGYQPRNWNPARAGVVTSHFGHSLGISEVWSYLVAAARATHELDLASDELWRKWGRSRLQIGFLNERQCHLSHKRAGLRYSASASKDPFAGAPPLYEAEHSPEGRGTRTGSLLLRPDGSLIVGITESWHSEHSEHTEHSGQGASQEESGHTVSREESGATVQPGAGESRARRWASVISMQRPSGNRADETARTTAAGDSGQDRYSPRWDPTLHSWECALLPSIPTPDLMLASEDAGDVAYRSLLLEMETGSNHQKEVTGKVTAYNRVIRQHSDAWKNAYGIAPRVLVVVRDDSQIRFQARLWRTYSVLNGETSVLLTSLQTLARVCAQAGYEGDAVFASASDERRALIAEPCWLDVMAREQPTWKSLGEVLYITEAQ